MKKASVNSSVQVIWWTYTFIPLGQIPGGKLLGHMLCIFHFIRGSQTLFQSDCTILHSHLQHMLFQSLCVIQCYLVVVLICISLMQMIGSFCQLIFLLDKYSFKSSDIFTEFLFFKLRLGIPDAIYLSNTYLFNVFYQSVACLFNVLRVEVLNIFKIYIVSLNLIKNFA